MHRYGPNENYKNIIRHHVVLIIKHKSQLFTE